MKTKIVYVLVSSDKDIYLEQAYVSMCSLKFYMPDAHITLLTDVATKETFHGVRKLELKYVDELVVVNLDASEYNAQKRSRLLKTSARLHVQGDFLFIDCDTIIAKPLTDIDKMNCDMAACMDTHCLMKDSPYNDSYISKGHLLGWPIEKEDIYYNTGVIWVRDCHETHDFYKRWNSNLIKGYEKRVFQDQPSFAKTNYEMGHPVQKLYDTWNCELKHGIRFLKDAIIVHYLCTNPSKFQEKQLFLMNEKDVLLNVKKDAVISDDIIEVIKDPFKGLAALTQCFAGEDVHFFRTRRYSFFRKRFKRGEKSPIDKLLNVYEKLCRVWHR